MNDKLPGLGDLPVPLATDPAFISALYGFSAVAKVPGSAGGLEPDSERRRPEATAAMSESDAPVNQLADAAKTAVVENTRNITDSGISDLGVSGTLRLDDSLVQAAKEGIRAELSRWRKIAIKEVNAGKSAALHKFSSNVLPESLMTEVKGRLFEAGREVELVKSAFDSLDIERHMPQPESAFDLSDLLANLIGVAEAEETKPQTSVPQTININMPAAPPVSVTVPERSSQFTFNLPEQSPPIVNVKAAEAVTPIVNVSTPNIHVDVDPPNVNIESHPPDARIDSEAIGRAAGDAAGKAVAEAIGAQSQLLENVGGAISDEVNKIGNAVTDLAKPKRAHVITGRDGEVTGIEEVSD